jgi:hypothetical protein
MVGMVSEDRRGEIPGAVIGLARSGLEGGDGLILGDKGGGLLSARGGNC